MNPSAVATRTNVEWTIQHIQLAGSAVPIARLRTRIYLQVIGRDQAALEERCWLDTGAPISVVPFHVHSQGIAWQRIAGVRTIWAGQPCSLGHVAIWLRDTATLTLRGPLALLAKFPDSDPVPWQLPQMAIS